MPGRGPSRLSQQSTYAVAAASTVVLLALAGRYGPHRDELYFIAAGHHPQWGYPDQPPLTPLVARGRRHAWRPGRCSPCASLSAVIVGVVVLLTADLARALGGGRGGTAARRRRDRDRRRVARHRPPAVDGDARPAGLDRRDPAGGRDPAARPAPALARSSASRSGWACRTSTSSAFLAAGLVVGIV